MARSRLQRRILVISSVAAVAFLLAGCSGSPSEAPPTGATSTGGDSVEGKSVFIVSCINAVPFCAKENELYKTKLEAAGAKVTMLLDAFSGPDEAANIQQAVSQGADLIGYVGNVQAPAKSALEQAKAAGIPVVILGTLPEPVIEGLYTSYVGPDETKSGETAAAAVQEALAAQNVTDGTLALITGTGASLVVQTRDKAWDAALKSTPGLKVVDNQDANWDPVSASQIAQTLFTKYPDGLDAIWAHSGAMAAGVVKAAQQVGISVGTKPGDLLVVGTNCDPTSIQAIKDGTLYATSSQGPTTDAEAQVDTMLKILKGESVPKSIETENVLITADNVADFETKCNY
jgi:ribose transport system substrate-binding protein